MFFGKRAKNNFSLTKREIWLSIILIVAFWITRLINLRLWPIFTDEAIYTRWSQIALHDASLRFIPLTDGKQPLWHWFTMSAMKLISDPLIAGRFISTCAGFFAFIGIWFLTKELFKSKKTAFLASTLYLLIPFTLFYDRIALVDSMLAMWIVWAIYFGVKTAKSLRLDFAMLAGFAIGAGLLTKSPAVFLQYLYPLNLLFIKEKRDIKRWAILVIPTLIIVEGMRNIMRLSPWLHMVGRKNLEFIVSFEEFFKEPFRWFWGNLPSLWHWWTGWLTWPVMLAALFGFALLILPKNHQLSIRSRWREMLLLIIWASFPFLVAAAFGKVIFARYLLFITPALIILAAVAGERILSFVKRTQAKVIFLLFLGVTSLYLDFKILTDPIGAPIIQADRDQYVDGFPAGWGIDDVIDFLKKESKSQKIFLGTQGTFGLMPYSFELYLWDNPNIEIHGFWPVSEVPEEVAEKAKEMPSYFIYYESNEDQIPEQQNIELINKYRKGRSERYMYFYQVHPEKNE